MSANDKHSRTAREAQQQKEARRSNIMYAVIAVLFPIAFSTIPGAGIPLLVLLMSFSHCAAQISPTHICLEIAVNYFKSDFRTIIAKTLPVTLFYCVTATLYYLLLTLIF